MWALAPPCSTSAIPTTVPDTRAPHDSWPQKLEVTEVGAHHRDEAGAPCLAMTLLGAYHGRTLRLEYVDVFSYSVSRSSADFGDWQ